MTDDSLRELIRYWRDRLSAAARAGDFKAAKMAREAAERFERELEGK